MSLDSKDVHQAFTEILDDLPGVFEEAAQFEHMKLMLSDYAIMWFSRYPIEQTGMVIQQDMNREVVVKFIYMPEGGVVGIQT